MDKKDIKSEVPTAAAPVCEHVQVGQCHCSHGRASELVSK